MSEVKLLFEEQYGNFIVREPLKVHKIIFSDRYTIVFWTDNTKTIVKQSEEDDYDPYAAVAQAYVKKIFGSNSRFQKMVDHYLPDEKEGPEYCCTANLLKAVSQMGHDRIDDIKRQEIISNKDIEEIKEKCGGLCEHCRNYYLSMKEGYQCAIYGDVNCNVCQCHEYNPNMEVKK